MVGFKDVICYTLCLEYSVESKKVVIYEYFVTLPLRGIDDAVLACGRLPARLYSNAKLN